MAYLSNLRVIISGNMIETYRSEKPICYRRKSKPPVIGHYIEKNDKEKEDAIKQSRRRSYNQLRRLVNANAWQYKPYITTFLTLTYAENMQDLPTATSDYTAFIKRLNYHAWGSKMSRLKYVATHEFQKRGAIHYHAILFNMPFVKKDDLADLWSHGFIKIKSVTRIPDLGSYLGKYIMKSDESNSEGKRRYFPSKGLYKPVVVTRPHYAESIALALPPAQFSNNYDSEHHGKIVYTRHFDVSSSHLRQALLQLPHYYEVRHLLPKIY